MRRNSMISKGVNAIKTHTKSRHPYKMIHAETDAVIKANCDLRGSTLYVARILKDGSLAFSKPCEFCQAIAFENGVKRMVYVDRDGSAAAIYNA
jgi:deoxycytidylate deaminase